MSIAAPTTDVFERLRREVIAALEGARSDGEIDPATVRAAIARSIGAYERRARSGEAPPLGDPTQMAERLQQAICGHGPISQLLQRNDVEEIFIEGARVSYLDALGRLHGLAEPTSEWENRQIVDRLLSATDRHLSVQHPLVQARILDGAARLTAAIPPVSDSLSVTLRKYTVRNANLEDLVSIGTLSRGAAGVLRLLMRGRTRVIVSGEPGAGKTTLLTALLNAVPPQHCIRVCEEIREVSAPLVHGAFYETRPPGMDGSGEITLRHLVKFVLAMRPDRIVVGEVRGAEAFELSRAVNAGCGFLCTVHANDASDALNALVNAALMAGENVTESIVRRVFSNALDVVVQIGRVVEGTGSVRREVSEILAVHGAASDGFVTEPLFRRDAPGAPLEWQGSFPDGLANRLKSLLPDHRSLADIAGGSGIA